MLADSNEAGLIDLGQTSSHGLCISSTDLVHNYFSEAFRHLLVISTSWISGTRTGKGLIAAPPPPSHPPQHLPYLYVSSSLLFPRRDHQCCCGEVH